MSGARLGIPAHPHSPAIGDAHERRRAARWAIVQRVLFATSFHNAYRWRNRLLRWFGATIDPTVRIRPSCRVDRPWNLRMERKSALGDGVTIYAAAPVSIGERSVISQYVVIAATRGQPGADPSPAAVSVGDDCWIAAESFVPGGAAVPSGVVVGARAVLPPDDSLEAWTIASGDPARSRRDRGYQGRGAGEASSRGE